MPLSDQVSAGNIITKQPRGLPGLNWHDIKNAGAQLLIKAEQKIEYGTLCPTDSTHVGIVCDNRRVFHFTDPVARFDQIDDWDGDDVRVYEYLKGTWNASTIQALQDRCRELEGTPYGFADFGAFALVRIIGYLLENVSVITKLTGGGWRGWLLHNIGRLTPNDWVCSTGMHALMVHIYKRHPSFFERPFRRLDGSHLYVEETHPCAFDCWPTDFRLICEQTDGRLVTA